MSKDNNKKTGKRRFLPKPPAFFLKILGALVIFFLLGMVAVGILFIYYTKDMPRPEKFTEKNLVQSTKIYDRTGQILLYEIYGEEKRSWVSLEAMPTYLKQMAVATEDANFYGHFGIDPRGILRAIWMDLKIKKAAVGGSTIPQQLIRSTFLTNEKTGERKIREAIMAIELDRRYSKDQILEWYLNQVPFGQNAYGVEAASQSYFNKPVKEVNLGEAAALIAFIQSPSYYSSHHEDLFVRKNYILDRMVETGYLPKEEAEAAKGIEVKFTEKKTDFKAPYFTLWVKKQLEEQYGKEALEKSGLTIYTTLDWELQMAAEEEVKNGVKRNYAYYAHNAALVASDPKTGEILAMTLGSGNYYDEPYPKDCAPGVNCLFDPQYNVAVENPGRQPGSSFKPFVYATAFENGYSDTTVVIDEPTCFGIWGGKEYCPKNFDLGYRGPITLRQALGCSLNVPAVKVLNSLAGLQKSIDKATDMGITTLHNPSTFYGLSLVLGGGEVKLIDMVNAYGVFATNGMKMPVVSILKISDNNGNIIYENNKTPRRVLSSRSAYLINSILSDNNARAPIFGYNSNIHFPEYQVAAKTGTTSDYKDGWVMGYTPQIVVGIWTGNNNNAPLKKEPGSVVAGPIFHSFMDRVLPKYGKEAFSATN
jgi:1A family penicillin-binding protein